MGTFEYHVRDYARNTNVFDYHDQITRVKSIADRLQEARLAKGWTQGQLGKAAGVSQSTIGNIESGTRKDPRELLAIAAALDVSPDWLKSGKEPAAATRASASPSDGDDDAWPFKTINAAQLTRLPAATLDHLERMMAAFIDDAEPLPEWRITAKRMALRSDEAMGRDLFSGFVAYVDDEHAKLLAELRSLATKSAEEQNA